MSSRIYANGNQATAISNITADVAGFISFNANGEKVLNVQGLQGYLETQFALVASSEFVSPATASSAAAAAKTVDTAGLANGLNSTIDVSNWQGRSDWPTSAEVLTGSTLVSSVKDAMAQCDVLSAAITVYYADLDASLSQAFTDYYNAQGINSLVPAGVVPIIETRAVIYTYVTDKDEESAPSPASDLANMDQNDTASYTASAPPGGRFVNRIRWYRSQSSNSGAAFAFVSEVDVGTLTYADSKKAEELQEPCPTTTWAEPPAKLAGLVAGPNGAHAGFIDNTLCPCENYVPYAFPVGYQKTTAWPIVGIGTFGQTYVVLTRGKPYYMSGADSASLDSQPIDSMQACVSRRSIVSGQRGVYYASAEGICRANQEGVRLLSGPNPEGYDLFDTESWQALVPSSIFAIEHDGHYIFHYDTGTTTGCYALDLSTGKLVTLDATGSAFFRDLLTNTLYLANGTTIKALFVSGKRTATWKSKLAVMPNYMNFAWLQVDSNYEAPVTVKLYREGVLTDTKVLTSRKPVRVSSSRALEHEVQIDSAAKITSLTLASTSQELREL